MGNAKDREVPSQQPRMEATQFIYYTMGRTHIKNVILRSGDGLYQELESNHVFLIKVVYAPDWIHFPRGRHAAEVRNELAGDTRLPSTHQSATDSKQTTRQASNRDPAALAR